MPRERGGHDDALERGSDDAYREVNRALVCLPLYRSDPVLIPKRVLRYFVYVPVTTCNTLVLSIQLAFAFHEHKHHPSIHEHEHMKFHLIHSIFITCDVAYIHAYACDHV